MYYYDKEQEKRIIRVFLLDQELMMMYWKKRKTPDIAKASWQSGIPTKILK